MTRPTDKMNRWYDQPEQKTRWGHGAAKDGLYPTEKALVTKYFTSGKKLLNIGCGGGREALALASDFELTAVDFNCDFCDAARELLESSGQKADIYQMDALSLDFEDDSFDYVVMVGQLIGQIPGRENRVAALAEARRVLRDDGLALVSTNAIELGLKYRAYFALINLLRNFFNPHNLEPDDAFIFRSEGRYHLFGDRKSGAVFHWYRTSEFLKDIKKAGFECKEHLRRFQFETKDDLSEKSTSGETFYILAPV